MTRRALFAWPYHVAPYLGRMNDAGRDGMGTITEMQKTAGTESNVLDMVT